MLLSSASCAPQCREELEKAIGKPVVMAPTAPAATALLREKEYDAIVIDEGALETEPLALETMLRHASGVIPIYVNFGIATVNRVIREVRLALRRAEAERQAATQAAKSVLSSELRGAVTGILLSADLALAVPQLPESAEVKLRFVRELAENMRRQLGIPRG